MSPDIIAVIFDMDGTIFKSYVDWKKVRKNLRISFGSTILDDIMGESTYDRDKIEELERIEFENTMKTEPFEGFRFLFEKIKNEGIKTALITNNSKKNSEFLLNKFSLDFDIVITREMKMWKPNPHAFRAVFDYFSVTPEETISVGDSEYDIISSRDAGIKNIYIKTDNLIKEKDKDTVFFNNYSDLYYILFGKN